jgi:transposase-like protein
MGLWIAENEGAIANAVCAFWAGVLNEIRNRGVEDILIACMDGLTGFPDAVRAVFPNTHIQRCIVHMVRNSTRFVSYKDLRQVCADLKAIYTAPCEEAGRAALSAFGARWGQKYPMIAQAWSSHWADLSEFFKYPSEIRRVIYTTNAIESLNYQLRKVTRNRSTAATQLPMSAMSLSSRSCTWRCATPPSNGRRQRSWRAQSGLGSRSQPVRHRLR